MVRIMAVVAAIVLTASLTGSVLATDVTNSQVRTIGAEGWFGTGPWDTPEDAPPGIYTEGYIQAFVSTDSQPGRSLDWIYVGYSQWEKLADGGWEMLAGAGGYAADGAAGLTIDSGDLSWATVAASIDVGWCRAYAPEDEGGDCTDYVESGTVDLDLDWLPTSRLLTWTRQDQEGWPSHWRSVDRRTSHYREASMSGWISGATLGRLAVSTPYAYLTRWDAGGHTVVRP